MYDVRSVDESFACSLSELWRQTFTEAYSDVHSAENRKTYGDEHFTVDQALRVLGDDRYTCQVAFKGAEPVGYYILQHDKCPVEVKDTSLELKQIYIRSSEYGKGLGKTLFDHAVGYSKDFGVNRIWLCVSNKNIRAQAFYEKLCFRTVGDGPCLIVGTDELTSSILLSPKL